MTDIRAADALHRGGDFDAAADAYRRLIAADPGDFAAWYGLGGVRLRVRAYGEARDALLRAVRLRPDDLAAWGLLAEVLFKLGDVEPAIEAYRRTAAEPSMRAVAEENLAIILPGSASAGNADVLAARRAYGRRLAAGVGPVDRPARPPSGGKLRIGYVSAFFDSPNWMKPVYGVINRHDRERFEVHLVSLGRDPSAAAGYRDHAHDVIWPAGSTDDETVARRLAAAGIDVLVDLNAYSAPKSLRLFLRRPAPVQFGWFNSFATSGLDCFDGIIGDDVVIPAAEERFYTERVLRVRGTYLAFDVLYGVPDVAPPPCSGVGGRLTFGALASAYKLNDLTLGLWARTIAGRARRAPAGPCAHPFRPLQSRPSARPLRQPRHRPRAHRPRGRRPARRLSAQLRSHRHRARHVPLQWRHDDDRGAVAGRSRPDIRRRSLGRAHQRFAPARGRPRCLGRPR